MDEASFYDVIIVGAGPAGLSTALHLARLAPDLAPHTLILEKARHPRPKLCGGALVADAEVILRRLGLDVTEIPHLDARAAHFDFAGRGLAIRLPKGYTLRLIRRDEFDAWLAEKARQRGFHIQEQTEVKGVRIEATAVVVETSHREYRARLVVGADGSNGVVRRAVLPDASLRAGRALEVLVPPSADEGHRRQDAYFDFHPVPQGIAGYVWDFPAQAGGEAARLWGIYDAALFGNGSRPPLRNLLRQEMARCGYRLEAADLRGWPIRLFDPFSRFAVPGVILVGDAAGADPVFGEGISFALAYGQTAARAIRAAFAKQDFSFRDYRRRVLLAPLGQALTLRWLIAWLLYSLQWRWLQALLWWVLKPLVALVGLLLVVNWARRGRR
ncbi:MAG: FAD-dependent monooxygenase [Anaerolineales bacterium]